RSIQDAQDGKITPAGTGPFKFGTWTAGQQLVLEANPDYWDTKPSVQRIIMRPVPEGQTRVNLLETGEAHVASQIPPQEIARLKSDSALRIDIPPATSWQYFTLNTQQPPLDDARARQALNYAIDKKAIVERILFGVG